MEHIIIYKREGFYSAFPQVDKLNDGRLAVILRSGRVGTHFHVGVIGERVVLDSTDGGRSWARTDDPAIPYNWPGAPHGEIDTLCGVMADGAYLTTGVVSWEE